MKRVTSDFMPFKHVYVLPIILGLLVPLTCLITYTLAVFVHKEIPAILPYISDTGASSLERCIFTLMSGVSAVLMFLILYIRYRQVDKLLKSKSDLFDPKVTKINAVTMYMSCVATFCNFLLGCFPITLYFIIHLSATAIAFGLALLIVTIQTYLSFKIYPYLGLMSLNVFRAVLVSILFITLILAIIFGHLAQDYKDGYVLIRIRDYRAYTFHLISAFNEWVFIFGIILYVSLYAYEFKSIVIYEPNIEEIEDNVS